MRIIGVGIAAIFGVVTFSAPLIAQQKTEKACQEEWRAHKAANQAKGITEEAYVTQCRTGSSMAPAPAASTSSKVPLNGWSLPIQNRSSGKSAMSLWYGCLVQSRVEDLSFCES
jgi:hypothetical protein